MSHDDARRAFLAYTHLQKRAWYPPRDGDLIHIAYEATPATPAYGETYALQPLPDAPPGYLTLRLVHHTAHDPADAGLFAPGAAAEPLVEIWAEAGAHRVTVVRDGTVIHNGPGILAGGGTRG